MIRALALAVPLALAALLSPAQATGPFQPVGLWRFFHTDGSPFLARLQADPSATTTFGTGEVGIWRWEGERVRVYYTSGWDNLLYARDGGFRKAGWAPGADRCAAPSNDAPVERLSDDPNARP